jgi:hypothetical protein
MANVPTILFISKVAQLTAAQLSGASIKSFELRDDTLVILFNTAVGKLQLQAKDGAAGGIFQMETEFASNVTFTHTLGPKLFYFVNSVTGKINFGDGIVCFVCSSFSIEIQFSVQHISMTLTTGIGQDHSGAICDSLSQYASWQRLAPSGY